MSFRLFGLTVFLVSTILLPFVAQAEEGASSGLTLELNSVQDTGNACRLTFVAENGLGQAIEKAVFETVIFDDTGGVVLLSLFDFRDLPVETLRVRQFDVPGQDCGGIARVLINGTSTCSIGGGASDKCAARLNVSSRIDVELLG
ncbi:MAG: hypothetical protein AB3N13_07135 [Arenibacterium sp.]